MFYLQNKKGEYYSLANNDCLSTDKKKATTWDKKKEAQKWLDTHSIFFDKLTDLGFELKEM